jgi:hypothetical protein
MLSVKLKSNIKIVSASWRFFINFYVRLLVKFDKYHFFFATLLIGTETEKNVINHSTVDNKNEVGYVDKILFFKKIFKVKPKNLEGF